MATSPRKYRKKRDSLEPGYIRAFQESVALIKKRSRIGDLIDAIAIDAPIAEIERLAGITDQAYQEMSEAIREAYKESATFYVGEEVPDRFAFRFNMSAPEVQAWLTERSSSLITGDLIPEQRRSIQAILAAGNQAGQNPRRVALDIVGRVGRSGSRTGGVIGLSYPQTEAYIASNVELATMDRHYFTRQRRDRRFDAMVRRAFDSGEPLTSAQIDRITGRYSDRLLQLRGETIARTESTAAFQSAGQESMEQVVQEGLAERDAIQKVWDATGDSRTRESHWMVNGASVGLDERFANGLLHPGDVGAPAEEVVNCRCNCRHVIDFSRTVL